MSKRIYCFFLFFLISNLFYAQEDFTILEQKLNDFAKVKPRLNEVIKIDVSGLSLYDLIVAISEEHQLNVSVDNDLNVPVVNNFHDVTVRDAFLFLAQKYNLEIGFMSNIMTFKKRKEIKIVERKEPKKIDISYNPQTDFLSIKLQTDSITAVVQTIIDKTGKNIILAPDVKSVMVSSYILNRPFDQVIDMMAKSNDLITTRDENGFIYLEKNNAPKEITTTNSKVSNSNCIDGSGNDYPLTVPLSFRPKALGTYQFRFWTGVDTNGTDQYIEHEVVVDH